MKFGTSLRRSAAVVAVAVATFVAAGSGAQAAPALPNVMSGIADATALHVTLQLPTVAQLQSTLAGVLGQDPSALPAIPSQVADLLNTVNSTVGSLDEKISLNHGEVMHGVTQTADHAMGFANPLTGTLDSTLKTLGLSSTAVSSNCTASGCTSSNPLPTQLQGPQTIALPAGLGTIKLAGAQSITKNMLDTQNYTGLVDVKLSLAGLLGAEGLLSKAGLSQVGSQIQSLTDQINQNVVDNVNKAIVPVIKSLQDQIATTPLAPVQQELNKFIEIKDALSAIPDLTTADLLDLSVLTAGANVTKSVGASGKVGALSFSNSRIANLDILKPQGAAQGWAHVDAITLNTKAFADGVASDAIAQASSNATGGLVGGLLGLHVANTDLADLLDGTALTSTVSQVLAQAHVDPSQIAALTGAVDMLTKIANIKVDVLKSTTVRTANLASATAGTLKITVSPQIPVVSSLASAVSTGGLPDFSKVTYKSSGVVLTVEAPNTSALSTDTIVSSSPCVKPDPRCSKPRTGVGTPFAVAFVMIGAAIVVKKFALAR